MLGMKADGKHAHDVLCLCLADFLFRAMRMPLAGKFENGIHDPPGFPETGSCCFQEQGAVRQRAGMREKRCDIFRNLRDFRLRHRGWGVTQTRGMTTYYFHCNAIRKGHKNACSRWEDAYGAGAMLSKRV
jgi:hypothetical protein